MNPITKPAQIPHNLHYSSAEAVPLYDCQCAIPLPTKDLGW